MLTLLLATIFLPLAAAVLLLMLDIKAPPERARWTALIATVATFISSWALAAKFLAVPVGMMTPSSGPVIPRIGFHHEWLTLAHPASSGGLPMRLEFFLGLDGISIAMIVLTTILTISAVLISWTSVTERAAEFYASLLILETGLIGVFCAFDVVLFYVFFEFTLIPLFFLVGIWGGPLRQYAAYKFFLYTLAGSLITLLGLVYLIVSANQVSPIESPFSIPALAAALEQHPIAPGLQNILFCMIAAGFLVKVPVFPFHTWLPLAHVEAPTAGSVMLAGVLLKLGTYGFLRLCLPMVPHACVEIGMPLIAVLAVVGIIYGSFCALAQDDIKKLVAYSSVAHLGFCMLGIFALNKEGLSGGILQMINHGLSTGALFCLVGMFYERYHTRSLHDLGGLASRMPRLAVAMVFITFASIGLPGLNGFVGEVLSLMGMFKANAVYGALGAVGVVLGAWYMLGVLQTAFFGVLREPDLHGHEHPGHATIITDMNAREMLTVAPLAALCLWIGLFPQHMLDLIEPEVTALSRVLAAPPVPTVAHTTPWQPPGVLPAPAAPVAATPAVTLK